jgi:hypothetical protein
LLRGQCRAPRPAPRPQPAPRPAGCAVAPRAVPSLRVNVVAATGLHQVAHCPPGLVPRVLNRLAALFVEELTVGIRERQDSEPGPSRAGLIKVAGEFHALSEHARRVMTAAAEAHHATGAPIGVHLEHGTAGREVIELIGGDTTTSAARGSTGGGPGIPYLLRRLRPRLVHELGAAATEEIFLTSPARAFGVTWS